MLQINNRTLRGNQRSVCVHVWTHRAQTMEELLLVIILARPAHAIHEFHRILPQLVPSISMRFYLSLSIQHFWLFTVYGF